MSKRQLFPRCLAVLVMLFAVVAANAQDIIVRINGDQVKAKVEEITESLIRYRKASNPTGPVYSIPLSSVASIRYENGEVDYFSEAAKQTAKAETPHTTTNSPSDDELMAIAARNTTTTRSQGSMSDAELMKLYNVKIGKDYENQLRKASQYKKIGWIGGASFAFVGIVIGLIADFDDAYYSDPDDFGDLHYTSIIGGLGIGVGAIWCASFNIAANNIKKKAQLYSAIIYEKEIMHCGSGKLYAGVNLMGNNLTHDRTLGVSFKLNF